MEFSVGYHDTNKDEPDFSNGDIVIFKISYVVASDDEDHYFNEITNTTRSCT